MKIWKRLYLAWEVLIGRKYASAYPQRKKGDKGFRLVEP